MVCLVAPAPCGAAELTGRVLDPQGAVVPEARVRLFAASQGPAVVPLRETVTDREGRFRFLNVAAGEYRAAASKTGFQTEFQIVRAAEASPEIELKLALAGVHEGTVVTASRQDGETFEAPLATALVGSGQLNRQVPINLAQALEEIPGVNWINAGAFRSRPVIRGLDSNRILVLVDGERLNNSRTSTSDAGIETSLVDLAQVEQVEVVRGPGSVLYGSDAFGGVVNIRTRRAPTASGPYFAGRVRGEFFPNADGKRANLELAGGARRWSVNVVGTAAALNEYDSPAGMLFGSGVDQSSALGEMRFYPAHQQSVFAGFQHSGAYNFGLPSLQANPVFLATFPFSKLQKFSGGYNGAFQSAAVSAVQARFYRQAQSRDFFNRLQAGPSVIQSDTVTDVETLGFDLQATSLPWGRHVFTYGSTFYHDRNRDSRLQVLNPGTPGEVILSQAPSVPDSTLSGLGFFLQDQFALGARLRVVGGVRVDRFRLEASPTANFDASAFSAIENRTDTALSGNLGTTLQLTQGWVLTANVARAFREPNLFERYFFGRGSVGGFVVPNPALEPETSVQFDAGTRVRRGPARISFNYFLNRLDGLVVREPATFMGMSTIAGQPVSRNVNLEDSRIQGVESSIELLLEGLRAQWTPFVSLAWQRGTNLTNGEALPLIAPFVSQAGLRWQPRGLNAWTEYRMRLATGSDRVPAGAQPVQGFTAHAVRWGYELARSEHGWGARLPSGLSSINFHFGIENVTNRLYRNLFEAVPEPGRSFRFGMDINFDTRAR
ncbi:MAG: TonB-dependent receptor [Candidatus Acidiferrales bacterium]